MTTIAEMFRRVSTYSDGLQEELSKTVEDNTNVIRRLQLDQFASGLDNNGNPLSPNYDADPYFAEQASLRSSKGSKVTAKELSESYKKWKWTIRPQSELVKYPDRKISMPNLFIDGTFWGTVYVRSVSGGWEIGASWINTPEMEEKYRTLFGLAPRSRIYLVDKVVIPALNSYKKRCKL